MLSIWVDSIESTRIIWINWSLWPCFKNEEGSCIITSRILTSGGLCIVGWKCCQFEPIGWNQQGSFPLLSICHARSRFARRDSVRIELRRNMPVESNRKVPRTNPLSLGVLDMDALSIVTDLDIRTQWILPSSYCLLETRTPVTVHWDSKRQLSLGHGQDKTDGEQNYLLTCRRIG